jgi:hypothetical protein
MTAKSIVLPLAAVVGACLAAPAFADAIDGDWCAADGRHFSIRGPAITTPAGIQTAGNYARHSFTYVLPEGETEAGAPVAMLLLNENSVKVQVAAGDPEIWLRCTPEIS